MSPSRMLQHILLIGDEVLTAATPARIHNAVPMNTQEPTPRAHIATLLGAGLPPISAKLVLRIEAGEFINMAEFLPERLDPMRTLFTDEPEPLKSNEHHKTVTSILEWTQCFAIYFARNIQRNCPVCSVILS